MRIQIQNTTRIVEVNGVPCRVWEGATDTGIDVVCLITRIAALRGLNLSQFETELQEQSAPTPAVEAFPLRMIL